MRPVEVVLPTGLAEPLALLEEALRDGDPVPEDFADRLRKAVEAGDVEVLAARAKDQMLGVVVLAYRLNVSAGGLFASIEDLYVRPETRRQGIGRAFCVGLAERGYRVVMTRDRDVFIRLKDRVYEATSFPSVLSMPLLLDELVTLLGGRAAEEEVAAAAPK